MYDLVLSEHPSRKAQGIRKPLDRNAVAHFNGTSYAALVCEGVGESGRIVFTIFSGSFRPNFKELVCMMLR